MVIIMGIILVFILIVLVWFIVDDLSKKHMKSMALHYVILLCVIVLALIWMSIPSAMEVYQGKTELKYTIQNNTVTDSVVVYKKEK